RAPGTCAGEDHVAMVFDIDPVHAIERSDTDADDESVVLRPCLHAGETQVAPVDDADRAIATSDRPDAGGYRAAVFRLARYGEIPIVLDGYDTRSTLSIDVNAGTFRKAA